MPRPDPKEIMREATRLRDDRYSKRDALLERKRKDRFGESSIDIPAAYKKTAEEYHSPIPREEGRQVASLISADPQPHIVPPTPESQPLTTKNEVWLSAMLQELESFYGSVWWKTSLSQIHEGVGYTYFGAKRKPYDGQPTAPDDDEVPDYDRVLAFQESNDRFKRDAGISSVFDYRHVPTNTVRVIGSEWNPLAVYEVKQVDERELCLTYGLKKNSSGAYEKIDNLTTTISGEHEYTSRRTAQTITVVEYWDRQWCMIVCDTKVSGRKDAMVLEEWEHNWGRVPYFCRPAFENEVMDEDVKFEGPLEGIYAEIKHHNRLRTMIDNVAYNTAFTAYQLVTKESGEQILDDNGVDKAIFISLEPGKARQLAPGQELHTIPQAPEVAILASEVAASAARIEQFGLSQISRGVSPGADTANSAISQLRRLQRSSLQPMADNAARQAREIFKFALQRVRDDIGEAVYVYDRESGDMISLAPEDVITLNVQVEVTPDTGTDALIEEKQAAELKQTGLITELEFHERRGKENPEEFVRANVLERFWMLQETTLQTQVLANLGDSGAIAQLVAANQATGDARDAVGGIMEQIRASNGKSPTGMGSGSGQMPRQEGVRSPNAQQTTQPQLSGGY